MPPFVAVAANISAIVFAAAQGSPRRGVLDLARERGHAARMFQLQPLAALAQLAGVAARAIIASRYTIPAEVRARQVRVHRPSATASPRVLDIDWELNGGAYRIRAYAAALGARHKRTRPYRPQTNGKDVHLCQAASRARSALNSVPAWSMVHSTRSLVRARAMSA